MKTRLAIAVLVVLLAVDIVAIGLAPSLWVVPAALGGWYVADLMSGVIHMYMDYKPTRAGLGLDRLFFYEGNRESDEYITMRDEAWSHLSPIERLIYDFKNHHPRPDALGRRTMLAQIGSTIRFATMPFALLGNAAFLAATWTIAPPPSWLLAGFVALTIGSTFAQYFHGTLHRADVPWPVRWMRRLGLLMRPEDHIAHHDTLQRDFSTINGWSNPALNLVFDALRRRGRLADHGLIPR